MRCGRPSSGHEDVPFACVLRRSAQVVYHHFAGRIISQKAAEKKVVGIPPYTPCRLLFCAASVTEFLVSRFSPPGWWAEKVSGDSCPQNSGRPESGPHEESEAGTH